MNSRIWDMIDDYKINNLAKSHFSAAFHSPVIRRRALYGDALFVPCRWAQTWQSGNNKYFCH